MPLRKVGTVPAVWPQEGALQGQRVQQASPTIGPDLYGPTTTHAAGRRGHGGGWRVTLMARVACLWYAVPTTHDTVT